MLSGNKLTWIPNQIGNMHTVQELDVTNNPMRSPPLDIIEQGTMRILRFLRMLALSESSHSLDLSALSLKTLPLMVCRQSALTELKVPSLNARAEKLPVLT